MPDLSAMTNAEGLMDLISRHSFDFVVHGHKHIPRFSLQMQNAGHPFWILCAGSFSASQDNRYFEAIGNNFHLVEFHDRCELSKYARGVVRSWTHYSGPGWKPSVAKVSIDSDLYFGALSPRATLEIELKKILSVELDLHKFVEWRKFLTINSVFRYYGNEALRESLKSIAEELDATMHEIDDVNLDQLVILKR